MTEKDIRPIPKNILKRIQKLDSKYYPGPDGHVRCYAYLTTWKNELVKVNVAVQHRYKKWSCNQVAVNGDMFAVPLFIEVLYDYRVF